jgi:hypothetical protein
MNMVESGKLDIVWTDNEYPRYSYWENGKSIITEDNISDVTVSWLAGIGRGDGKIKIGYNSAGTLCEAVKSIGTSNWSVFTTNFSAATFKREGSYAVNSITGRGTFVYRNTSQCNMIYDTGTVDEGGNTVWCVPELVASINLNFYAFPDLIFDSAGEIITSVNNAKLSGSSVYNLYGGYVDSLNSVCSATSRYNHSIAYREGNIAIVVEKANDTSLYQRIGSTWTLDSQIVPYAVNINNGTFYHDSALALSSDGKIASLFHYKAPTDTKINLYLGTKDGFGTGHTWSIQRLTNDNVSDVYQDPDIKFDSLGNLYLVYWNPGDSKIHLLTTLSKAGDVNGDNSIDNLDLEIIRGNWGLSGSTLTWQQGDLNGDKVIDALDLNVLCENW